MLVRYVQKCCLISGVGAVLVLLRLGRKLEFLKQYFTYLLRRRDVEQGIPGQFPDLGLSLDHLFAQMGSVVLQRSEIDFHSIPFHLGQYLEEWLLHGVIQVGDALFCESLFQLVIENQ